MALKVGVTNRLPRGTKMLINAFFAAADEIPEGQRDSVVKAAMSGIRDGLKAMREKAKVAKAKTPLSAAKASKKVSPAKIAAKKEGAAKPTGKKASAKRTPSSAMPEETAEM
jgi:hypothetical protein